MTALYGAELEECTSGNLAVNAQLLALADAEPQIAAELAADST